MSKLESIKERLKPGTIITYSTEQELISTLMQQYRDDATYLLQRLERYEKALKDIVDDPNGDQDDNLGFTYHLIAEEALKE